MKIYFNLLIAFTLFCDFYLLVSEELHQPILPGEDLYLLNNLSIKKNMDFLINSYGDFLPINLSGNINSIDLAFKNIVLNDFLNHDFDLSGISLNDISISTNMFEYTQINVFSELIHPSFRNQNRINFQGGNKSGSTFISHKGFYNSIYWHLFASYLVSNSDNNQSDSTVKSIESIARKKATALATVGLQDNNSLIELNYFYDSDFKQFPNSFKFDFEPNVRNTENLSNLFILQFSNENSGNLSYFGNLYYKNEKKLFNQDFGNIRYFQISESIETSFGTNFNLLFNFWDKQKPIILNLKYDRQRLNLKGLDFFGKYELEKITLNLYQDYIFDDIWELGSGAGILINNVLMSDEINSLSLFYNFQYFVELKYKLDEINLFAFSINSNNENPDFKYIFTTIIDSSITNPYALITNRNIKFDIIGKPAKYMNYELSYQFDDFTNINLSTPNQFPSISEDKIRSHSIRTKFNLETDYINLEGIAYYHFSDLPEIKFQNYNLKLPKYFLILSLYKTLQYGTSYFITFDYRGVSEYSVLTTQKWLQNSDFVTINILLKQKIINSISVYLKLNNLLDIDRIMLPNIILPKFNFIGGVDVTF